MDKEKVFRVLGLIFGVITFIGAGIVLFNKGEINPGIAVLPSVASVLFSNLALAEKKKK